jgi:hypothetical protein
MPGASDLIRCLPSSCCGCNQGADCQAMTGRVDARQFPYLNEMPRADIGWTEVGELISAAARFPSRRSAAAFL